MNNIMYINLRVFLENLYNRVKFKNVISPQRGDRIDFWFVHIIMTCEHAAKINDSYC